MIYLDTSATVKLVADEEESVALIGWLNARPEQSLATSVIGHIELMRAAARMGPAAVARARVVASTIDALVLTDTIVAAAQGISLDTLRTLDAIHVATAQVHRAALTAFCAYDRRLLEAAASHDLPAVSPRA